jgi:hypothetical protein
MMSQNISLFGLISLTMAIFPPSTVKQQSLGQMEMKIPEMNVFLRLMTSRVRSNVSPLELEDLCCSEHFRSVGKDNF